MRQAVFSLLFILSVAGCVNRGNEVLYVDLLSYMNTKIDYFSLVDTASYRYVKLELTEGSLLGVIGKVQIIDSKIIILDISNKSVFIFDMEGNFIAKAGHNGRGPGEYIEAINFTLDYDNGHIIIADRGTLKQIFYDLNGRFVKEYKIHYHPLAYVGGKFYQLGNPMVDGNNGKFEIVEKDSLNRIIGGYYPRPRFIDKPYIVADNYFIQNNEQYYFVPMFTDELWVLSENGAKRKHRFGFFGKNALDYDRSKENYGDNKFGYIDDFEITDEEIYHFTVSYGTKKGFHVFGNLKTGNFVASAWMPSTEDMNPSFTFKTEIGTNPIGSHNDEFISAITPAYYKDIFPDATEDDNPYLVFFKLRI